MTNKLAMRTLLATMVGGLMSEHKQASRISSRETDPTKVAELKRLAQEKRERKAKRKAELAERNTK